MKDRSTKTSSGASAMRASKKPRPTDSSAEDTYRRRTERAKLRREQTRAKSLEELLAASPERADLDAVQDEQSLRTFLKRLGPTLSVLGAKYLITLFDSRYDLVGAAACEVQVSEHCIGVILANLPPLHRDADWAGELGRRREWMRVLHVQERNRGWVYRMKSDLIEWLLRGPLLPEFEAECKDVLHHRREDWRSWAQDCAAAESWEALLALVREPRRPVSPPSDVHSMARDAVRTAITRIRSSLDRDKVHVGRVLERGGKGSYVALLLAFGATDPVAVRSLGHSLFQSWRVRQDVNRMRERPLMEAWTLLSSKHLRRDEVEALALC